jgi:hypothetical protein
MAAIPDALGNRRNATGKHRHLMAVNCTPEAEKRGKMMATLETVVPLANEVRICAVSY